MPITRAKQQFKAQWTICSAFVREEESFKSHIPSNSHVVHLRHGAPLIRQRPRDHVAEQIPAVRDERCENDLKKKSVKTRQIKYFVTPIAVASEDQRPRIRASIYYAELKG